MRATRRAVAIIFGLVFAVVSVPWAAGTEDHYVRGTLLRVTESEAVAGGGEHEKHSAYTPRVSANGEKVVFYSDGAFSGAGYEEDNDYHIWM